MKPCTSENRNELNLLLLSLNFIIKNMKRITTLMIAAFAVAALCFTACGHEGGGSRNQEYPSTAEVIRNAVKDIDGNKYDAVKIGNQVWMASNLRTTRYADGTAIPLGETPSDTIPYRYAPGMCKNNEENMINVSAYGYLYNWSAVMHGTEFSDANPSGVQGICPAGWHVPSDAEWTQLTNYVARQDECCCCYDSYNIAKALASNLGWKTSNEPCAVGNDQSSNNASGFSTVPAGDYGLSGSDFGNPHIAYSGFGIYAKFWTSSEGNEGNPIYYYLLYDNAGIGRKNCNKGLSLSVRCVRD